MRETTEGEKFARLTLSEIDKDLRKEVKEDYPDEDKFFCNPEADYQMTDLIKGWKKLDDDLDREEITKLYKNDRYHQGLGKDYDQKLIYEDWRVPMLPLISMFDDLEKDGKLHRKVLKAKL